MHICHELYSVYVTHSCHLQLIQCCGESSFGRGCFATGKYVHTHVFHELYYLMCHELYHSPLIVFCGESTFDVGTMGVAEISHIFHELYHLNVTNCFVYIFATNDTWDMDCVTHSQCVS